MQQLLEVLAAEGHSAHLTMLSDEDFDAWRSLALADGQEPSTQALREILIALCPTMISASKVEVDFDRLPWDVHCIYVAWSSAMRILKSDPSMVQTDRLFWLVRHCSVDMVTAYAYCKASDKAQRLIDFIDEDLH